MSSHELFKKFDDQIRLSPSRIDKLKKGRSALRELIRGHYREKGKLEPLFWSQGSFPLNTIINPIPKTKNGRTILAYDIDDGVYFSCPIGERDSCQSYHYQIQCAVAGHTDKVANKNTCVRVVYSDGHHIDLPIYWKENKFSESKLAHLKDGFVDSDPSKFSDWAKSKFSELGNDKQPQRLIRYLKAWKDYRKDRTSKKIMSGFVLTILVIENYSGNGACDHLAILDTVKRIHASLVNNFECYLPYSHTDNLMKKYDEAFILEEIKKFIEICEKANGESSKEEACELWRELFGSRFPMEKNKSGTCAPGIAATAILPASSKPHKLFGSTEIN
ncbi:MAG: hypothetical protein K0U41_09985 [Gammaproteobacteria bacterium]|nr:hypothetical protein [Gammaproteobacteria bacterium]